MSEEEESNASQPPKRPQRTSYPLKPSPKREPKRDKRKK